MAIRLSANPTNSHSAVAGASEMPGRGAAAQQDRGGTRFRLREALAREAVLRRQMDGMIRQQQEALSKLLALRAEATDCVAHLTPRQRQIMKMVLAGAPSKNIAADLGISRRTVESHRAAIMKKTGSKSLPALARLALVAVSRDDDEAAIAAAFSAPPKG